MKLTHIHTLTARLELITGLKIGGSNDTMRIGGVDNPIIRNPRTDMPYIPGSSLKGKLRSLLEWQLGLVSNGNTYGLKDYSMKKDASGKKLLQLFGYAPTGEVDPAVTELGVGRLSFYDAFLENEAAIAAKRPNDLIEVKAETAIDRVTGTARTGTLRIGERVSAGYAFDFKVNLKQFEGDTDLLPTLLQSLKLLELDSLGGSGSRGYGKVKFTLVKLDSQDIDTRFAATDAFTPA